MLLDEATAALDAVNEAAVAGAIRELAHQRTVVVVAHRLSTVMAADQILVLDNGRITARGPPRRAGHRGWNVRPILGRTPARPRLAAADEIYQRLWLCRNASKTSASSGGQAQCTDPYRAIVGDDTHEATLGTPRILRVRLVAKKSTSRRAAIVRWCSTQPPSAARATVGDGRQRAWRSAARYTTSVAAWPKPSAAPPHVSSHGRCRRSRERPTRGSSLRCRWKTCRADENRTSYQLAAIAHGRLSV